MTEDARPSAAHPPRLRVSISFSAARVLDHGERRAADAALQVDYPRAPSPRADELLESLGLADHRHKTPDQLSGGQRQRVAVARALANDPPVILADEPTGSLDSASTAQVFGILRDLVTLHGKTVVAVTHDLNLASQMHRRIHVVDGRLAKHDQVAASDGRS
jgi:ABC-type lipoprotein export system ATPase subunit